ncbi:MAG TPA: helix-turn-helix transcriptional regulator [Clostridia bacterium]|nr:MAG: anaerobic benzoate catabolism transcriptional regulator [Firmicutes bacterium ADurb.Bin146]HOD93266.1 helix-turn-helix transcriptional regulator [Clostridia bacterium]HQM39488.1 helix-turn-helix transcriptional regulator [Clostridia bacterium]
MSLLYRKFGNRVREKRVMVDMSQETLAEKCDVSTSYIGLVERGERKPSLEIVLKIANALNVTPNSLTLDSIKHKPSNNKDKLVLMINDFDDTQINTTFEIVNQIHSYIKKDTKKAACDDIDKLLFD